MDYNIIFFNDLMGLFCLFQQIGWWVFEYLLMVGEWWFELGEKEKGRGVKMSKK